MIVVFGYFSCIFDTRYGLAPDPGIDERDMLTLSSVAGRQVGFVHEIEEADIENGSLVQTILNFIRDESGNAELAEDKQVLASAFQYSLHGNFAKYMPKIKADVQELCGSHLNDYTNFHDAADDSISWTKPT